MEHSTRNIKYRTKFRIIFSNLLAILFVILTPSCKTSKTTHDGEIVTYESKIAAPKSQVAKEQKPPLFVRIFYRKRLLSEKYKKTDWGQVEMLNTRIAYLKDRYKGFKRGGNRKQATVFKKNLDAAYSARDAIVTSRQIRQYNRIKNGEQKKLSRSAKKSRG